MHLYAHIHYLQRHGYQQLLLNDDPVRARTDTEDANLYDDIEIYGPESVRARTDTEDANLYDDIEIYGPERDIVATSHTADKRKGIEYDGISSFIS